MDRKHRRQRNQRLSEKDLLDLQIIENPEEFPRAQVFQAAMRVAHRVPQVADDEEDKELRKKALELL